MLDTLLTASCKNISYVFNCFWSFSKVNMCGCVVSRRPCAFLAITDSKLTN